MKNSFLIVSIIIALSGCYSIETKTVYNKSLTQGESSSKPIYLSFADNKKSSFHFLLKHAVASDEYLLHTMWDSPSKELLFDGKESTLKFLVDRSSIIELKPIRMPKIISYNIETKGHREEAVFLLTEDQIRSLANARNVLVELTGKYIVVEAKFNRFTTYKAFKDFVKEG